MTDGFPIGVVGINHGHINGQVDLMLDAGCTLVAYHAIEDDLAAEFSKRFPDARRVADEREILEDPSILMVVGAGIASERAPMAVRAMRAGKDVMVDKPGCTTLEQLAELRQVQAETGRIFSICYSEHFRQRSTVAAGKLVQSGAIGRVIHSIGMGPHSLGSLRDEWFWDPVRAGHILVDIASHQFEQFLFFTGSTDARVVSSMDANFEHPDRPDFQDYGHAVVASPTATGFIRVDWFTPTGSPVWGDGRIFLMGTEGTIELRKYMDTEGRPGGDHLFLTDKEGTRYMDCTGQPLEYGEQLRDDVRNRTETAMPQDRCFLAMDLALQAAEMCERLDGPRPAGTKA